MSISTKGGCFVSMSMLGNFYCLWGYRPIRGVLCSTFDTKAMIFFVLFFFEEKKVPRNIVPNILFVVLPNEGPMSTVPKVVLFIHA